VAWGQGRTLEARPRPQARHEDVMLGLYLHIPFCQAICGYCNFNRGLLDGPLKAGYVAALEREIRAAGDGRSADSVFFGGGTPSLLEPTEVATLIRACRQAYAVSADAEITLETNPETATPERLAGFLEAGVNRISFGVQSFDASELTRLGRIHSADRAEEAVRDARGAGVTNLSLDLMLWLPGQSMASWQRTVARAIALEPDHLSLYLLELYPNAPLKEAMARAQSAGIPTDFAQVSDDLAADMYLEGLAVLDEAGYAQYEISNVTRRGLQSRHNLKYWQSGDWRGFGCGAHSTDDGARWHNVASTTDYIHGVMTGVPVAREVRRLSWRERVQEALFTGLRLSAGVNRGNFRARFGVDPWSAYGDALSPHLATGHMWTHEEDFGLTRSGMLVANEILEIFV
jgi:oxygen-independent coproporphyrinogen-3 oxidase